MRSTLQRVFELILSIKDKTPWQQIQIWFQATIKRNFRWSSLWSHTMNSCQVMNSGVSEIMKREKRPENSALNLDFFILKIPWNKLKGEICCFNGNTCWDRREQSPNNVFPAEPVETIPGRVNKQRNCCPPWDPHAAAPHTSDTWLAPDLLGLGGDVSWMLT